MFNSHQLPTFPETGVSMEVKKAIMKTCGKLLFLALMAISIGCDLSDNNNGILVFTINYDFSYEQSGWEAGFTDYPATPDDSIFYELTASYTDRPGYLGANQKSIMLSGNNHSDDLFMFIKKKVTGLYPNTDYNISFEVEFASNAPRGSIGIGGSPGESVFLKAGAAPAEPLRVINNGRFQLSVDKGNQSQSGTAAIVLGNVAVDTKDDIYRLTTKSTGTLPEPFVATTNEDGELWMFVGTDSGFEGITTLYYTRFSAVLSTAD